MDAALNEREVLCLLDTRQIQRFMFRSNTLQDALGASDLMNHIQRDAIEYALTHIDPPLPEGTWDICTDPDTVIPYFTDEKILFQLLTCTAGNAMFVARTGALARKIVRKVSRYYLDHTYSLNLAAAIVEKTGNYREDIYNLYRALDEAKASPEILEPMGALPVVGRERKTGAPVVGTDENTGEPVSRASMIRRQEAKLRGSVVRFDRMNTTRAFDGNDYRAVIHADGNNLGIIISRILQQMTDYEEAIHFRRKINTEIEEQFSEAVSGTVRDLKDYWMKHSDGRDAFVTEFQIVCRAGDDINVNCNANLVFPFLQFFYRNLKGTFIWKDERREVPLYCCAGVAFVRKDCDYHSAFRLAEECCSSAKKAAKAPENLRNGLAGNWVDFQVMDNPNSQELAMLRRRYYRSAERISLLLRPYCLDPEAKDQPYAYSALTKRIRALRQYSVTGSQRAVLHQSFMMGVGRFSSWITRFSQENPDLANQLGKPIWWDPEDQMHATWFDAEELMDFVPAEEE